MKKWLISILFIFLFLSCLTVEKKVEYLKPAEITIPQNIRNIAVLSSGYQFREEAYDILFNIFGKQEVRTRFNLIDRKNLDIILKEQNLYNNDEFDDKTAAKLGKLTGADAVIIGAFKNVKENMNHGVVILQRRYLTGYKQLTSANVKIPVYKYIDENVPSIIKTYLFTIDIRMLDITTGTLIHSEQKTYKAEFENFIDNKPDNTVYVAKRNAEYKAVFPQIEELLVVKGKEFGQYFAKKVAPYYVSERMSIEKIMQDSLNKNFIKYVETDLYDEALTLMLENLPKIDKIEKPIIRAKHYYNIGCVYEIKDDLDKSLEYYSKAAKEDPNDLHLEALKAIKERINEKRKLDNQLKKDTKGESW